MTQGPARQTPQGDPDTSTVADKLLVWKSMFEKAN